MGGRTPSVNYRVVDPKIRKLYLDGISLNEIARRLALHVETVRRRVQALGIPVRNVNEAMVLFHEIRRAESA